MAQIILDSNNNLIQGDFDNATLNNRTKLQTTTTNATTNVYVVPNGSSTSAGVSVANNSSLTNASKIVMATNGTTDTQIISGVNGSGTYLPLSFYTNNALGMQLSTAGNLTVTGTLTATGGVTGASLPAGSVIQVVQVTDTTRTTYSSGTTFLDTLLSLSITPSSSSNKILLIASVTSSSASLNGYGVGFRVLRNGSTFFLNTQPQTGRMQADFLGVNGSNSDDANTVSWHYLDSPATTSALTYKIQGGARDGLAWSMNQSHNNNDSGTWTRVEATSTFIAMEIKG
jgi:hypothetical protein